MEEMPVKTAEELEAECLRVLKSNPRTREITRVGIVRLSNSRTGPNWSFGELYPLPTIQGLAAATDLIATVSGKWALTD